MLRANQGKPQRFGMEPHIGLDATSGLAHTAIGTAACLNDVTQALLDGDEACVWGDDGSPGTAKRPRKRDGSRRLRLHRRRGLRLGELIDKRERLTVSGRAIGHPLHAHKISFRHRTRRYRGLVKNAAQLFSPPGVTNLVIAKRSLLARFARGAS